MAIAEMNQGQREECGLATAETLEERIASAIVEVQALYDIKCPTRDDLDAAAEPLREALALVRLLEGEIIRNARELRS